jgi:Flp pilus assembly protein TadD
MRTFQLRLRGKLKAPGLAVILIGVSVIFAGAWSAVVRFSLWRAGQIDASLAVSADEVFSAGYEPAEDVRERAERAVALFEWAGPITSGGIGWTRRQSEDVRMAWLLSVAGRFDEAESLLLSVSDRGQVDMDLVESLLLVMRARGASGREILETLDQIGRDNPELLQLQVLLAQSEARSGSTSKAFDRVRRVAREAGDDVSSLGPALELMTALGRGEEARSIIDQRVAAYPRSGTLRMVQGLLRAASGDGPGALEALERASELEPDNPAILLPLADVLQAMGRSEKAREVRARAQEIADRAGQNAPHPRNSGPS